MSNVPYLGSKEKMLGLIEEAVASTGLTPESGLFLDLFAGSGRVGRHMRSKGWRVCACDSLPSVYPYNFVNLELSEPPQFEGLQVPEAALFNIPEQSMLAYLSGLEPVRGFITANYTVEHPDAKRRNFFSVANAMRIDAIRQEIERIWRQEAVTFAEYSYMLACLLLASARHSNSPSRQAVFARNLKGSALEPLVLKPFRITQGPKGEAIKGDSFELLRRNLSEFADEGGIVYIDPPYTRVHYHESYHISNTIALYDEPELTWRGFRKDKPANSGFYRKTEALETLRDLLDLVYQCFSHVILSYSNDGFMPIDRIEELMKQYGTLSKQVKKHLRYNPTAQEEKELELEEHLFILKVGVN